MAGGVIAFFLESDYNRHMKRRLALFVWSASVLAALPAFAQQVQVSDRECRQLVDYVASQDVNYKPGVDVYGRPVKSADLSPQTQVQVPQNFTFDVNIDLKKYGIPASSPIFQPTMNVGKISVEDGGRRVSFNGQPLGNSEQQALAELCKQRGAPKR
jgi:hypothetical protein